MTRVSSFVDGCDTLPTARRRFEELSVTLTYLPPDLFGKVLPFLPRVGCGCALELVKASPALIQSAALAVDAWVQVVGELAERVWCVGDEAEWAVLRLRNECLLHVASEIAASGGEVEVFDFSVKCDQLTSTDEFENRIAGLSLATSLAVPFCQNFTDSAFHAISASLRALRHLTLTNCFAFSDAGLLALSGLPSLQYLCLSGCCQITSVGFAHVARLAPQLEMLDGSCCDQFDTNSAAEIAKLRNLVSLNLAMNTQFGDDGAQFIAEISSLTELSVGGTSVTSVGMEHIAKFARLTTLDVGSCTGIDDVGLAHLSPTTTVMAGLSSLFVNQCDQITDVGLRHLSDILSITELDVRGCGKVTEAGVAYLRQLPCLVNLRVNTGSAREHDDSYSHDY